VPLRGFAAALANTQGMTYATEDSEYVVENDPTYVAPIAEGIERTWISRNWWLPLLAALALASLLIWLANRHTTCQVNAATIPITSQEENTVISHFIEVLPGEFNPETNRAQAMTVARNICAAHLGGESGDTLTSRITTEFSGFIPDFNLADDALRQLGTFIGTQSWCRC